jgi:hypothetical protein
MYTIYGYEEEDYREFGLGNVEVGGRVGRMDLS